MFYYSNCYYILVVLKVPLFINIVVFTLFVAYYCIISTVIQHAAITMYINVMYSTVTLFVAYYCIISMVIQHAAITMYINVMYSTVY